jgi:hypothetical protein
MEAYLEKRVRAWLLDRDRLRADKQKLYPLGKPSEQDILNILAVLDWPEYRHWHSNIETGASVMWCEMSIRRAKSQP